MAALAFTLTLNRSQSIEDQIASKLNQPLAFSAEELRQQARWIRDILDPQVAREGHDALHSDEILTLDELLRKLASSDISLEDIRYSRIHLAIRDIAGRATRWPKKLVDRSDVLKYAWTARYGPLKATGLPLYESGGRLNGICRPEDLSKEKLLVKWLKSPTAKLSPAVARRVGDLGFTPGDWWINPLFAHRAGIIDSGNSEGGIVSDTSGAYAVVMTGSDEVSGPTPEIFQYRARDRDPGRYRLTAGTPESRHPVRILRSHTLRSFWKPRAGLRYDGLCVVDEAAHDNSACSTPSCQYCLLNYLQAQSHRLVIGQRD
ncbi:hypothetical protein TI39_contig303g00029 [Zymoseptoria brevis]|uniref:YDG domain-containing protein n=1 Tax=Zymoseptoria brevis TaxID=1047168 RepID=A0A0F4GVL3_9PEZI|nr:hypothetical protein TI39_contig303g00029 [Zymoseptoria brevis]